MNGRLWWIIAAVAVTGLHMFFKRKGVTVKKEEYLEVLSSTQWMHKPEIIEAMKKIKGPRFSDGDIDISLFRLCECRMIEREVVPYLYKGQKVETYGFRLCAQKSEVRNDVAQV